jgi:hypothetical protein
VPIPPWAAGVVVSAELVSAVVESDGVSPVLEQLYIGETQKMAMAMIGHLRIEGYILFSCEVIR